MTEKDPTVADGSDHSEVLTLITELGESMNRSMYPVSETTLTLKEVSEAYGDQVSAQVFSTYVIALDKPTGRVAMGDTGSTYRFDQVAAVGDLVVQLRNTPIPAAQAITRLREIADSPTKMPWPARVLGFLFQALGFALCFRMSVPATVLAVVISLPIAGILLWSRGRGVWASLLPFLLTFLSALVIALWAVHAHLDDPVRLAVIPVVTLIPGAGLTIALMELTAGEMIAGASRLVYTLLILLSMAFGLALAIDIVGLTSGQLRDITSDQAPAWVLLAGPPIFALGNILYSSTPKKMWAWTIVFAFATFWITEGMQQFMQPAFAAGIAMGVCLMAAFAVSAHTKNHPSVLVIFLPTFWLMVPGSMGFVAITGVITADRQLGDLSANTALSLLSMAMCMLLASALAPYLTGRRHRMVP